MTQRLLGTLLLVTALGAGLIFANLDDRLLWDDEAETALLAQRVLSHGVPTAWDGRDLISQRCGTDYDGNYLWRESPWAQVYLTAGSFKLFGVGTLTARLPGALLGVLAIVSLYVLGVSLFADRRLAVVAAAALVGSVPFLLYARQARYYALAMLAAIWVLYCFFALLRDRPGAVIALAVALSVVFHANYLLFAGTVAGLGLAFVAVAFERRAALRLGLTGLLVLAINLPWVLIFDLRGRADYTAALASAPRFAANAWRYLSWVELYACSIVLLIVIVAACSVGRAGRPAGRWPSPRVSLFLALFAIGHVLVLSAAPYRWFRYLVVLFPALALLEAAALRALWARSRAAAVAAAVALVLVDRADLIHGSLGSPLLKYLDEVTHHVPGPLAGIVSHLRANARPGERVFIMYGDLPVRFYTGLEVRGGLGCQGLAGWPLPEWLITRSFRIRTDEPGSAPGAAEDAQRTLHYLAAIPRARYGEIRLADVERMWESIPEPSVHLYRAPVTGPPVSVYRRIEP